MEIIWVLLQDLFFEIREYLNLFIYIVALFKRLY